MIYNSTFQIKADDRNPDTQVDSRGGITNMDTLTLRNVLIYARDGDGSGIRISSHCAMCLLPDYIAERLYV